MSVLEHSFDARVNLGLVGLVLGFEVDEWDLLDHAGLIENRVFLTRRARWIAEGFSELSFLCDTLRSLRETFS